MSFATTDLSDAYPQTPACDPIFRDYGGHLEFHGPITTLRLFEDNSLVRKALEGPGEGRVLVVDGGGSLRCALLGDQLAELAVKNGWAGVVVNGCVRDSAAIAKLAVGVKALATHPRKSEKRGVGDVDRPVTFAGVTFHPGDWVYADGDGLLLSPVSLAEV
jgi:regulator of ribonuclease activity A